MAWWGALRRFFNEKASAFAAAGFLTLGLALFLGLVEPRDARADITFPTQIPKTSEALSAIIKAVPGLDPAGIKNFKAGATSASAKLNIKGEAVSVVVFKRPGVSKVLLAIVPDDFKLSSFLPIPSGTPVDGVRFKDMALVIVPKGAAKNDVSTSGLPAAVSEPLAHSGQRVDFKEGLNLFGQADFTSSGAIKKVLSAVGHNRFTLPLGGTFSADVFKHDLKTASQKLKEELLVGLTLNLPLPKLHIPGMPNIVYVDNAHLAIVGREVKGKRKIFAGVTGGLHVKIGSSRHVFNFGILASDPGKQWKATITAESKDKITLPFIHPLSLTDMKLTATKKGSKWAVKVDAKTKLRSKQLDVSYVHNSSGSDYLDVKTKMTLADFIGEPSLPGLDDIQLTWIQVYDKYWRMSVGMKQTYFYVNVFKPDGASKHLVAVTVGPPTISPAQFIPGTANSPLKDVDFKGLAFVYAPQGTAGRLYRNQMPRDIGFRLRPATVPGNIMLKPGLNVFDKIEVHPTGELAKLLKDVGIHDLSHNLNGGFSPKVFAKNISGTAIKNEILDHLDIKVNLPKLSLPGMSSVATIRKTHLTIKGVNKGGRREIDVDVAGELDVNVKNQKVAFDFEVDIKKQAGKPAEISVNGHTEAGRKITIDMIHPFTLESLRFSMKKKKKFGWIWRVAANTMFRSKPLEVSYLHDPEFNNDPKKPNYLSIHTKLTVAEIVGKSELPGLDDVQVNWLQVYDKYWLMSLNVKGTSVFVNVFKPQGASKHLVAVTIGPESISPAKFIPGTSNSPLKDMTFKGMSFVYAPAALAGRLYRNQMPPFLAGRLRSQWIPGNIVLKPGLNVFGKVDIHPTGEVANLLKKVGIHDLSHTLKGGFSPKAFSKNISGAAIKNAIMNALDLNIALPPLKIPKLDKLVKFSNGRLIVKGKTPDGKPGIYFDFKGDAKFGSHGNVEVDVEYDRTSGGASNFWVEVKGPIKLSEIPEVNTIPNAGKFGLTDLKISEHGIEAKTTLAGRATDIALFTGSGWTAAITQKNFTLTELIPPLKKTPLKHIGFPSVTLIISDGGIDKHYGDLGPIAQDALKVLGTAPGAFVQIASGITFIAGFHPDNAGSMKNAVKGIGVGVHAGIHGDNLLFDSKVKVQVMEEGFGIDIEGGM